MAERHITPAMFAFLAELDENNHRAWFQENKQRYLDEVRDPLLRFIEDFAPRLAKISKNLVADPRPVGGSLFRIYRDTRFSRDKRPYKPYAAMSFRHVDGRETPAPGFYLHLEPGEVFAGAGLWHPPTDALLRVRQAIVAQPGRWRRVRARRGVQLDERDDDLVRPPRGFDPEHPFIDDLKRRSFTASTTFTKRQACSADFLDRFAKACREKAPLMEFLTHAVGLPW